VLVLVLARTLGLVLVPVPVLVLRVLLLDRWVRVHAAMLPTTRAIFA
jgi:hypothetical protein